MSAPPFQDTIVAIPKDHAREIIRYWIKSHRNEQGYWTSQEARIGFRIFFLLDGEKHHRRISEILHISEPEVRQSLILLMVDGLISIQENTMNAQLLSESFTAIKPHGMEFAEHFYETLFAKGREKLGTNEIADLFKKRKTNMPKQFEALLGALAFVIAGTLENRNIEESLVNLGKIHHDYDVTHMHYQITGMSLLLTLQWYYAKYHLDWTTELQQTWEQAFRHVATVMQGGTTGALA